MSRDLSNKADFFFMNCKFIEKQILRHSLSLDFAHWEPTSNIICQWNLLREYSRVKNNNKNKNVGPQYIHLLENPKFTSMNFNNIHLFAFFYRPNEKVSWEKVSKFLKSVDTYIWSE